MTDRQAAGAQESAPKGIGRDPGGPPQAKPTRHRTAAGRGEGAVLLEDLRGFVRRYVVMTDAQSVAVTLWVVHTHAVMAAENTPYLSITSPERQCGKSRLMDVLGFLVARPWSVITPSEAVVYRKIHSQTPTLLLDEVDAIFNPRTADRHEHLRAMINEGNRRGAMVPRCIGASFKMVDFRVYCAKALAGIGSLPDTIADRSIPIRLKRRGRDEHIERLRRRLVEPVGNAQRDRIAAWTDENAEALERARPTLPDELSDRQQDACEPLLAIADRIKGPWPQAARRALVELCAEERADDTTTYRLRLLADIRSIYLENDVKVGMSTSRLLTLLVTIEEAPWGRYYGRTLEARDIAALLRHYGIHSQNIKMKNGRVPKGYKRAPLQDAWERYVDSP
jgi:Protein of unknown function (DUF3631)